MGELAIVWVFLLTRSLSFLFKFILFKFLFSTSSFMFALSLLSLLFLSFFHPLHLCLLVTVVLQLGSNDGPSLRVQLLTPVDTVTVLQKESPGH